MKFKSSISIIILVSLLCIGVIPTLSMAAGGYSIQTCDGVHYLTAVNGGGRTTDVIHSDATHVDSWETFNIISLGEDYYAIQTCDGHYLTAVNGGGRTTDVIHSDATHIDSWETFKFIPLGGGYVAIQTCDGVHYLTAVNGGGRTTDVIHSDATHVDSWEIFYIQYHW